MSQSGTLLWSRWNVRGGVRTRRNQYDALEEVLSPSMNFHGDSMEPNQLRVGLKLFSKNRPY
jgi:hypothetical protein